MLIPKKVKHRKWHKGRARNIRPATDKLTLAFGSHGLKAQSHAWVSARQIEAVRRVLARSLRKGGKVWIRIFPDKPVTKKPAETRMGKGKGAPEAWVAVIKPGRVLFELEGISRTFAQEAMKLGASKLPMRTRFVDRRQLGGE